MLNKYIQEKNETGYSLLRFVNVYDEIVAKQLLPTSDIARDENDDYCLFLKDEYKCDDIHSNSNLIKPLHGILLRNGFYKK